MVIIDRFKEIYQKYPEYTGAVFFLLGFIFDVLTLGRIDDLLNITQQALYLVLCLALLILKLFYEEDLVDESKLKPWQKKIFFYRQGIFHFLLGSLLSAYAIFYFKSSSFGPTFVFLTIILIITVLNETAFFQKLGVLIKSALLGLCFVSFFSFLIPVLAGFMTRWFNLVAVVLTLVLFLFLSYKLAQKSKITKKKLLRNLIYPNLTMFSLFLIFDVSGFIPPIPLSVTDLGIYRSIDKVQEKDETVYLARYNREWWKLWQRGDQTFYRRPGDKIYFFASVFAPGDFQDTIDLKWFRQSSSGPNKGEWVHWDTIALNILGGRERGFRLYGVKQNYDIGHWKVYVMTRGGREISRLNFEVIDDDKDVRSNKVDYY